MDSYYKLRQLFYYKVRHGLLHCNLRQVLQSAIDLLQIATGITKCDDYYKVLQIATVAPPPPPFPKVWMTTTPTPFPHHPLSQSLDPALL